MFPIGNPQASPGTPPPLDHPGTLKNPTKKSTKTWETKISSIKMECNFNMASIIFPGTLKNPMIFLRSLDSPYIFKYLQIRPSNRFSMPRMDSKLMCTKSTCTLVSGSVDSHLRKKTLRHPNGSMQIVLRQVSHLSRPSGT